MAKILKIFTIKDSEEEKLLRKKSVNVSVEEIKSEEFKNFLDDLILTAEKAVTDEGYTAAGLAAVQVGILKNVFCILQDDTKEFLIMINPQIKIFNSTKVLGVEGCLSVPNREGKVHRYKKVKVKYLNRDGNVEKRIFSNQEAREIQHEYDHTEGILFTDILID